LLLLLLLLCYCGFSIFISISIIFFVFLYNQLYHHHLLIPTLTSFTLPPSLVLQSILLAPNYSFCPFLSTSLLLSLPTTPSLAQPATTLPLPPTHSPPVDYPTISTLHNPNTLQYVTQAPYTITTEIYQKTHKGHKSQQPPHCFPYSLTPLTTSPFCHPTQLPKFL
jgi:hypothetical protein